MRHIVYLLAILFLGSLLMGGFLMLQGFSIVATQPQTVKNAVGALPEGSNIALPIGVQSTMPPEESYTVGTMRVLKIVKSMQSPYYLVLATQKSPECGGHRCQNDTACGSADTQPICYFFLEPDFRREAEPTTRFVGKWTGTDGVYLDLDSSIGFTDANTVRFVATGDTSKGLQRKIYELNLTTKQIEQVSE